MILFLLKKSKTLFSSFILFLIKFVLDIYGLLRTSMSSFTILWNLYNHKLSEIFFL